MIFISEWLPNPEGSDTTGEWVELFNNGSNPVSLAGWKLQTANGKSFRLGNVLLDTGDYVVLKRPQTKLTLRNSDEKIFLYDAAGKLADRSELLGTAQDGKSLSRQGNGFSWADPTPGAENAFAASAVQSLSYPVGIALNNVSAGGIAFWEMLIGSSALLSLAILLIVKKHEILSEFFFPRDPEIR